MQRRIIRRCLLAIFILAMISAPVFAVRYVDVASVTNVPLISVSSVEDFEAVIDGYQVPIVYRVTQRKEMGRNYYEETVYVTTLFTAVNGTYFSFSIDSYKTVDEYKKGQASGFKDGKDFYAAKKLGIDEADFYYRYSRSGYHAVEDFQDASKKGFATSSDYYAAKNRGYSSYAEYKEYLEYTNSGFKTKDEWEKSKKAGFTQASVFYKAAEAGFTTNSEYEAAGKVGLQDSKKSYDFYMSVTNAIDRIAEKDKLEKKDAFVLFLLQNLPKGEMSLGILSKTLSGMIYDEPKNVIGALQDFIFPPSSNSRRSGIYDLISTGKLQSFFSSVNIKQIGSYNSKTEIFKKTTDAVKDSPFSQKVTSKLLPSAKLSFFYYEIQEGDMISNIAERFGVTYDTLVSVNNIKASRLIQPGQVLRIPSQNLEAIVEAAAGTGVYWTKYGAGFHLYEDCGGLDRSETLMTGTVDEAMSAEKGNICSLCEIRHEIELEKGAEALPAAVHAYAPKISLPIHAEYLPQRKGLDWYTSLDQIRTQTSDPISSSVSVQIALGYKKDDKQASSEITARRIEIIDYLCRYFSSKTFDELRSEREEEIKIEILDGINDNILSNSKICSVIFTAKDVVSQ